MAARGSPTKEYINKMNQYYLPNHHDDDDGGVQQSLGRPTALGHYKACSKCSESSSNKPTTTEIK